MLNKKEYWWLWLILFLFSGGTISIVLADNLNLLDKDAWYMKSKYWIIGAICFFFPLGIMGLVFTIEMTCKIAAKLGVSGKELYLSPYIWLMLLIIPILGWILFMALTLYLYIRILISIYQGKLERLSK